MRKRGAVSCSLVFGLLLWSTATIHAHDTITNMAQLAEGFGSHDWPFLPLSPSRLQLHPADEQPWWVDLKELSDQWAFARNEAHGVKLLSIRLTRDVLSGETLLECADSGEQLGSLAPPADYQPGDGYDAFVLHMWEQCEDWEDEVDPPTVVLHVQLADIEDKPIYDENVAAEEAAWEEAQESLTTETPRSQGEGEGGMLLMGGEPCVITNEAQGFRVLVVEQTSNSWISVQFESCHDHLYQIEVAPEMTGTWQVVATLIGDDAATSWVDTNAPAFSHRFYRVRRLPSYNDFDDDGMPDGWELTHGLDPLLDDASADSDGDGLSNLEEYWAGTNPLSSDTDSDAIPDAWELAHGLNPTDGSDATLDPDGDGFSNLQEYLNGTDPHQFTDPFDIVVNRGQPYTSSLSVSILPLSTNFPRVLVSVDSAMTSQTVFTNSGTAFNYTLPDNGDGQYTLYLQYANAQNQPTTNLVIKSVTLDRLAPEVGILSPASDAVLDQAFITLQAVAADADPTEPTGSRPLKIWLNDEPFWSRDGTNIVVKRFPVPLGTNSFTVIVRTADEAGHTNQASRTWTVDPSGDTLAPHLTNFNIATTTLLPDVGAVWLEGAVDDEYAIVMAIGSSDTGEVATNALNVRDFQFEGLVPLEFGTNTVVMRASDAAGNATSSSFMIIRSDRYRFEITSPAFGEFATAPSNYVSGYVSAKFDEGLPTETNVTSVLINGVAAVLDTNVDADGNLAFTTTNAIPVGVPITGFIVGPGIPTDPPPDPPVPSQEYEVISKTWAIDEKFALDGVTPIRPTTQCGNISWRASGVYNYQWTNVFDLTVGGDAVDVDVYRRWRTSQGCTTDPEKDPSIWPPWDNLEYVYSYQTTGPRSLSFGTEGYHSYRLYDNGTEELMPWPDTTTASLTFKAPRHYDPSTTVIFTFEGMDYTRPEGVSLDLSQVRYQGRSPIAWSNEINSVSYLITVDGGRAYTISQDSFQWPSFTTNLAYRHGGANPFTDFFCVTMHTLSWTNFHNHAVDLIVQTVGTGGYNPNLKSAAKALKLNYQKPYNPQREARLSDMRHACQNAGTFSVYVYQGHAGEGNSLPRIAAYTGIICGLMVNCDGLPTYVAPVLAVNVTWLADLYFLTNVVTPNMVTDFTGGKGAPRLVMIIGCESGGSWQSGFRAAGAKVLIYSGGDVEERTASAAINAFFNKLAQSPTTTIGAALAAANAVIEDYNSHPHQGDDMEEMQAEYRSEDGVSAASTFADIMKP